MKRRSKMIWIFSLVLFLVAFWFYNFRWVEFYPAELDMSKSPKLRTILKKGAGAEIIDENGFDSWDRATEKKKNALKKALDVNHQDYIEKNNRLYIRAYLSRNNSAIANYTGYLYKGGGGEQNYGFFPEYLGYNKFSYFLDNFVMWRWDKKGGK